MKKTTLNGKQYDLVIIDGDIVAQGLTEDLIFCNAYSIMEKEAELWWIKEYGSEYMPGSYVSEFIHNRTPYYCQEFLNEAKVETYNLN